MTARLTAYSLVIRLVSSALLLVFASRTAFAQCPGLGSISFNVVAAPVPTLDFPPSICNGQPATISVNESFSSYLWSTGSMASSITVNQGGTYTVTVTNSAGCESSESAAIVLNSPPQPTISGSSMICQNNPIELSATGGFTNWAWSNGETTSTITITTEGIYTVTVTDANGCTGTDDFLVTTSNSNLEPEINSQPFICGQVTLNAGAGFATYTWSNGGSTQTINIPQGDYTVTVTDAAGCTGTDVINVSIPPPIQVEITGPQSLCPGGTATLTASAGFQNYLWSNGPAVAEISVTQPGTYTVTATDANGCTSEDMLTVVENTPPQPQILGGTTLCNGSSTILSINANFPDILWSTGETTPEITVSTTGTIGLQVTDVNGCSGTTSVEVTVSDSLSPQIIAQAYACDGQLILDAGVGYQTYSWSNGGVSQTVVVSQNGNYVVTVTSAGGCTGTAVFNANIPSQQQVTIAGDLAFCTGASSVLTGSTGFQNYLWSNSLTVAEITVTQPGTYSVTVTDANGCTDTEAVIVETTDISIPPQILGSATICLGSPTTLFLSATYETYVWSDGTTAPAIVVSVPGVVSVTVSDVGGCTGEASIAVTAGSTLDPQVVQVSNDCSGLVGLGVGNAYETYLWSNGGTNQITLVDQTGTYFVTVTDANGCTGAGSIFAQVPQQFSVSISGATIFCAGDSTVLTATGGFQEYIWSNGATSAEITISQAGNYIVTVSDLNGCTGTAQVAVTVRSGTLPQIDGSTVICVGGSTGLSITNAFNFTQILWSNGSTAPQITATAAGTYSVTVTDGSGCTATESFEVIEGNALAPSIAEGTYNCDGNLTLEASAIYAGYFWSTGSDAPVIIVTQDGSYSLTVTDGSGCTGTASIFVQVPDELVVTVEPPPMPICFGDSAQLSVPPGFDSYAWSTGETSNTIVIGASGVYAVTVTDQYGCTAEDEYAFILAETPVFEIIGDLLDCESSEAVLEIDLVDVSGTPSFLWSSGVTAPTLVTAQPGVFAVTVTDANGCSASQTTEVLQEFSFSSFADTIEFVPGQVVPLVPPEVDFLPEVFTWSPTGILQGCDNCPTAEARPIEDVLVNYMAVSAAGCVQEGTFFLFFNLQVRPSVYAPNVFSPDSPFNPAFTLFGNDQLVIINYLRVFSRWGEKVFELENLEPGDLSAGWDGTFRGQEVNPGVFVWVAEVVYEDGSSEVLKGDVTVIR